MLRMLTRWARADAPDINFIFIGNDSIAAWVQYMKQKNPESFSSRSVFSASESIVREYKAIKKEKFEEISKKNVALSAEMTKQFEDNLTDEFEEKCARHGVNLDKYFYFYIFV